MARILVTGAAGFLGFYIARQLADAAGNELFLVDNFSRGEDDPLFQELVSKPNVTSFNINLNDKSAMSVLPTDMDFVFHMAALNGTQNFYERPFEVVKSCTLPTIHLIEHFGDAGTKPRFIYAGTSESYAATVTRFGWELPTAEDVPLCIEDVFNSRWSYAGSKMHGEIATVNGCRFFDMPFTIVRFHNAYGPRMGDKHVIPDFYHRARNGVFELYGSEDTRSFIYGDDAAAATIALANSDQANGHVVNVGGSREIKIIDLAKIMMDVAQMSGDITVHPSPAGSVKRRLPNVDKAIGLIGAFEKVSLEDGLRQTAEFYLA